jgi:D-arabinose 1-dehydrogenase-like Zn-dependent alcohol dehydrogenase
MKAAVLRRFGEPLSFEDRPVPDGGGGGLGAAVAGLPKEPPLPRGPHSGVRAAFDFLGSDETLALAARAVERGGLVVQIGEGGGRLPLGLNTIPHEAVFTTSIWGSPADLDAVLDCARRGYLQRDVESLPLAAANTALRRLREGDVRGRLVLVP